MYTARDKIAIVLSGSCLLREVKLRSFIAGVRNRDREAQSRRRYGPAQRNAKGSTVKHKGKGARIDASRAARTLRYTPGMRHLVDIGSLAEKEVIQ